MEIDIRLEEVIVDGSIRPVNFVSFMLAGNMPYFKTIQTPTGADTIWRFNDETGIWIEDGIPFIEGVVDRTLGFKLKVKSFTEIIKITKVKTYCIRESFVDDPATIVLTNGEYNFITGTLEPYDSYHKHINRLPIRYDPAADCPAFKKFLSEVSPGDEATIQELFGYLLVKGYPIQKCFIFQGSGANGKSTLLRVMEAMLGKENCSSVGLFDLVVKTFSKAELYGKLANIAPDIGSDELKKTGIFKALTGGDTITAERKNMNPFTFNNYAKMIFSCNQLPTSPDNSDAFFRRFMIFQFKQVFDDASADTQLLEKLTTADELSGVFNWALIGYSRIMQKMKFTESRSTKATKDLYLDMSDTVTAFANKMCEEDPAAETVKKEIWRYYGEFCAERGLITINENKFFSELSKRVYINDAQKTVNGVRVRTWKGIRLTLPTHSARPAQDVYTQLDFEKLVEVETPVQVVQPVQVKEGLFDMMKRVVDVVEVNKVVSAEFVAGEVRLPLGEVERLLHAAELDRVVWCDVNGLWRFSQ